MNVLVVSEYPKEHIITRRLISAALRIGDKADVMTVGIDKHYRAEQVADAIVRYAPGYSAVIADSSGIGRDAIPRAAAILDIQPFSDVTEVLSPDTFRRPIYAGNAVATVKASEKINMLTVRASAFDADGVSETGTVEFDVKEIPWAARFISFDKIQSERQDLSTAKRVVVGGRGIGSADNFKLLEDFADKIGAAVGTTRDAADAGIAPNEIQVGQSGKTIAPDLYIGFGVSGAAQHVCGIRGSKVIVAVNKDADAQIFKTADYGLVADAVSVINDIKEKLQK